MPPGPRPAPAFVIIVDCHQHRHPAGESVFTSGPDSEMYAIRRHSMSGLSGFARNLTNRQPTAAKADGASSLNQAL
jgi:hypothetical protein